MEVTLLDQEVEVVVAEVGGVKGVDSTISLLIPDGVDESRMAGGGEKLMPAGDPGMIATAAGGLGEEMTGA